MKAIKDFTLYCQTTHEPTAAGGVEGLVVLLNETLEPSKSLRVEHVKVISKEGGAASQPGAAAQPGEANNGGPPRHTMRAHADLTDTGGATRKAFAVAVGKRWFPRYTNAGLHSRTHLFDHVVYLSPGSRKLKYIDTMLQTTAGKNYDLADAHAIKERVRAEVEDLVTDAIIEIRARAAKEAAARSAVQDLTVHAAGGRRTRPRQQTIEGSGRIRRQQRRRSQRLRRGIGERA